MPKYKSIRVLAARSQFDLDTSGAEVESSCEQVTHARARARYYTSPEYAEAAELDAPLGYARVVADGENIFDVVVDDQLMTIDQPLCAPATFPFVANTYDDNPSKPKEPEPAS